MSNLSGHETWFLPINLPGQWLLFPGPVNLSNDTEKLQQAKALLELAKKQTQDGKVDFEVQYNGSRYRGHLQNNTRSGKLLVLRKIPNAIFELEELGFTKAHSKVFLHRNFQKGGLVMVAGPTGAGKSTTIASIIKKRLELYGGVTYTLEDPPEMPLDGVHGNGVCFQCNVSSYENSTEDSLEEAMMLNLRGVLRGYPANESCSLMIGELRDGAFARHLLKESLNGLLIYVTLHAMSPIDAIMRLAKLAGDTEEIYEILGSALNYILYQKLANNTLTHELLVTTKMSAQSAIKTGKISSLKNDLISQQNLMANNKDIDLLSML